MIVLPNSMWSAGPQSTHTAELNGSQAISSACPRPPVQAISSESAVKVGSMVCNGGMNAIDSTDV